MPASLGPVLIVEDDAAVRGSLKFVLEVEGLQVRAYADPLALLNEEVLPSDGCLVVDQFLPFFDGIELVLRLRARSIHLPVILTTVDASSDVRQRASRCGVQLVFEKPVDGDALVASIMDALTRRA